MILNNRPEKYFEFGKMESLPPIVDYHCMRSNLRMGMLDVRDEILREKLERRELVSASEERGDPLCCLSGSRETSGSFRTNDGNSR